MAEDFGTSVHERLLTFQLAPIRIGAPSTLPFVRPMGFAKPMLRFQEPSKPPRSSVNLPLGRLDSSSCALQLVLSQVVVRLGNQKR